MISRLWGNVHGRHGPSPGGSGPSSGARRVRRPAWAACQSTSVQETGGLPGAEVAAPPRGARPTPVGGGHHWHLHFRQNVMHHAQVLQRLIGQRQLCRHGGRLGGRVGDAVAEPILRRHPAPRRVEMRQHPREANGDGSAKGGDEAGLELPHPVLGAAWAPTTRWRRDAVGGRRRRHRSPNNESR